MQRIVYVSLSAEDKERIKEEQKGVCAICFSDAEPLVIDHDHETEIVRQALCRKCNTGLGFFGDDWDTLLRAACYVLVHKAGLDDLRIGWKLLFEYAREKEETRISLARKDAKRQICQLKKELCADVEEHSVIVDNVGPETSTLKSTVL